MTSLAVDTHAALWWSFLPDKLSRRALAAIDAADELVLSGIVPWEVALLVRNGRVELPVSVDDWLGGLESSAHWRIVALDARIALHADGLDMHEDPADRFIVATALHCRVPLVTKDRAIRTSKLVPMFW